MNNLLLAWFIQCHVVEKWAQFETAGASCMCILSSARTSQTHPSSLSNTMTHYIYTMVCQQVNQSRSCVDISDRVQLNGWNTRVLMRHHYIDATTFLSPRE